MTRGFHAGDSSQSAVFGMKFGQRCGADDGFSFMVAVAAAAAVPQW